MHPGAGAAGGPRRAHRSLEVGVVEAEEGPREWEMKPEGRKIKPFQGGIGGQRTCIAI
jgi:hypothetical protein